MRAQRRRSALWLVSAGPGFSSRRCLGLLEEVWEALWGGSGLATSIGFATVPSLPSSESLLLDLLAARIGVYEENESHSSPHAVLVGPTGCRAVRNEPKHSSPKRFTGAVCSHIQRAHT